MLFSLHMAENGYKMVGLMVDFQWGMCRILTSHYYIKLHVLVLHESVTHVDAPVSWLLELMTHSIFYMFTHGIIYLSLDLHLTSMYSYGGRM